MIKHISKIYFLILMGSLLTTSVLFGQKKYSVVVDDIIGIDPDLTRPFEVVGDEFELTITSFEYYFNIAMVDVIDRSVSTTLPLSRYFYKPYDGDVLTDFYIGDLAYNKVYELRVVYMIYNRPQVVKRIRIIRRL